MWYKQQITIDAWYPMKIFQVPIYYNYNMDSWEYTWLAEDKYSMLTILNNLIGLILMSWGTNI